MVGKHVVSLFVTGTNAEEVNLPKPSGSCTKRIHKCYFSSVKAYSKCLASDTLQMDDTGSNNSTPIDYL